MLAAVSIYSVEGLAGISGCLVFGVLGDRFGARPVLVTGLLLQAFGALACAFARDLWAFYAAATAFGFIHAGVMPLYAVLACENFPLRMMGTVIGGTQWPAASAWRPDRSREASSTTPSPATLGFTSGPGASGSALFWSASTFRPFPKATPALAPA
jgi:MFS family permease